MWCRWLLPLLPVVTIARAQVPVIPDSLIRQGLMVGTDRFEGTHSTSLAADFASEGPGFVARGRAYLASLTTFLGASSTRDRLDGVFDLEYKLPIPVHLFAKTEATLSNDVRTDVIIPGFDKTASGLLAIGGRLYDGEGGCVGVAVGGAYSRQLNVESVGPALYVELLGRQTVEDYILDVEAEYRFASISPRRNANGYGQLRVYRAFEEGGSAALDIRYDHAQADLYTARSIDEIIQLGGSTYSELRRRGEGRMRASAAMVYPVAPALTVDISLGLSTYGLGQQQITEALPFSSGDPDPFRFDRDELGISMSASVDWKPEMMHLAGRLEYWTSEETNSVSAILPVSVTELDRQRSTVASNDYSAQQLRLIGGIRYFAGASDTIALGGSIGIYRYDTPSLANVFDRDEQSIHTELRWDRSFNQWLHLDVVAQTFLTHLVYLFGENSNNNNWNRVVRFSPTVRYLPSSRFRNDLVTELAANYTEYDFQDRALTVRGRSFREMRLLDSMTIGLTGRIDFRVSGELRIAERGSFNWERFVESPLERTRTEGASSELSVSFGSEFLAGVGGKLARVKIFRATPGKIELGPFSDRTSLGPTARIECRLSPATAVTLSGWWEHRFEESELAARLPWLSLSAQWRY